jgi:hypothetical protein
VIAGGGVTCRVNLNPGNAAFFPPCRSWWDGIRQNEEGTHPRYNKYFVRSPNDSAIEFAPFITLFVECLAGSHQKSKFLRDGLRVLLRRQSIDVL